MRSYKYLVSSSQINLIALVRYWITIDLFEQNIRLFILRRVWRTLSPVGEKKSAVVKRARQWFR